MIDVLTHSINIFAENFIQKKKNPENLLRKYCCVIVMCDEAGTEPTTDSNPNDSEVSVQMFFFNFSNFFAKCLCCFHC